METEHDRTVEEEVKAQRQRRDSMSLVVYVVHPNKAMADAIRSKARNVTVVHVQSDTDGTTSEEELLKVKQAEIIFGSQFFLLKHRNRLDRLVWFHSTAAGVNRLMKAIREGQLKPNFRCTRNGGPHGETMKEYVIGHMIAQERCFVQLQEAQKKHEWTKRQYVHQRPLFALTVGILGLGTIGNSIAKACKHFGMKVWGLKRTLPVEEEMQPYIDRYCVEADLTELLAACDYVINVLPSTPETTDFLGKNDVLQHAKDKKPTLISVGRGDVISEEGLLKALRSGWLRSAVLDVLPEEPLPASSPLWDEPNVTITPHCASSSFIPLVYDKVASFFMQNFVKYVTREPMDCEVDWERGY